MQSLGSVTAAQLRAPVTATRRKIELLVGTTWVDVDEIVGSGSTLDTAVLGVDILGGNRCALEALSATPSGAGSTSEVVCGSWSATVFNYNDAFHPFCYSSPYHSLFQIGRKVRISLGGIYGGTASYWQRLTGYMDQPEFDHKAKTVSLKGCDYSQRLTDYALRESALTAGVIDGPLHWGAVATFDSVASYTKDGSELYVLEDALDPAAETDSIDGSWDPDANVTFASAAYGSPTTYVAKMDLTSGASGEVLLPQIISSTAVGTRYIVDIRYRPSASGSGGSYVEVYQGDTSLALVQLEGSVAWHTATLDFRTTAGTVASPVAVGFRIHSHMPVGSYFYFDDMSIQAGILNWEKYDMPSGCNGPYLVTLNGEVVTQGQRNDQGHFDGWLWSAVTNQFCFDEDATIEAGTANLKVYYYTTQTVENVVADLIMHAGLYATRTEALAGMDYAATGVTIPRVRFDQGLSALAAIGKICERVNYRFWPGYDGTPHFRPAQTSATVAFDFASYGDLETLSDRQDRSSLYNRIVIEGEDQATFQTTTDKKANRWTGEASDATSIAAYGERTASIKNDLFQDQDSITTAAAAILAERKDPKWLATLAVFALPVPLEVGDTIKWRAVLGGTTVTLAGVIRNLTLDNDRATYTVEVVENQTSPGALPDIGAVECQKGVVVPPATGLPDIGAVEYQGA